MCNTCIHKKVCKHKEDMERAGRELEAVFENGYTIPAVVNLVCRHEEAEEEF